MKLIEGIVATRVDELILAKCQVCQVDVIAPVQQRSGPPGMRPICRPCVRLMVESGDTTVAIAPLYDDQAAPAGRLVVEP